MKGEGTKVMDGKDLYESFMQLFPYLNSLEGRSTEKAKPPGRTLFWECKVRRRGTGEW